MAQSQHPRTQVIACGALAREIVELIRLNNLEHLEITCLPAEWHNYPHRIPEGVRGKIRAAYAEGFGRVLVAYGDCGTGGLLDKVLQEEGAERIKGDHCYAFYRGLSDFQRDFDAGLSLPELSKRHWRSFFYGEEWFTEVLEAMHAARLGPFREETGVVHAGFTRMRARLIAAESDPPARPHEVDGREALLVHPDGKLRFAVPKGARRAAGEFGVHLKKLVSRPTGGVRFTVELHAPDLPPQVLFEKTLNPRLDPHGGDLHSFDVELPDGATGELVLCSRRAARAAGPVDWSYWTSVEFR